MTTVYGPYRRKDGRQHVIHYDAVTQSRRTQSYPRYLMEQHLGRELDSWEHVDHINGDSSDDRIENFQLLTQSANNAKAIKETGREAETYVFSCPVCGVKTKVELRRVMHNQVKQGKSGPYCSRSCAGKAR